MGDLARLATAGEAVTMSIMDILEFAPLIDVGVPLVGRAHRSTADLRFESLTIVRRFYWFRVAGWKFVLPVFVNADDAPANSRVLSILLAHHN